MGSINITTGETRQQRNQHDTPEQTSMVDAIARRYVVPLALVLDVITTAIRVTETSVQLILPDIYALWNTHRALPLAIAFYTLNLIVIAGLALGVTASLFLAMPLLALVNRKLDNASHIKRAKVRKDKVAQLLRKQRRCVQYIWLACAVPLLFGVSYVLSGLHLGWLVWVTAFADIAAPIIVLFVITQTEREAFASDTQEQAVQAANGVVLGALLDIKHTAGGTLQMGQAAMLRAGTDGDIEGMINAATPRDPATRYLTVTDICDRLHVPTHRDAPERRRIARRIKDTYDAGGTAIMRGERGQGYLVPGTLYDELFGDWQDGRPGAASLRTALRTPAASVRTSRPRQAAAIPASDDASVTTQLPTSYQTAAVDEGQPGATLAPEMAPTAPTAIPSDGDASPALAPITLPDTTPETQSETRSEGEAA